MFGKLMSIPDDMILRYETLLGMLPPEQLKQHENVLSNPAAHGVNPRDMKANMAKFVVGQYHGVDQAEAAEAAFVQQFKHRQLPGDMPETTIEANVPMNVIDLVVREGLAPSKSEARRLMENGAIKRNGEEKLTGVDASLELKAGESVALQVGKRRFLRVIGQ
jgi:tyrosyl-tRNA synthetase